MTDTESQKDRVPVDIKMTGAASTTTTRDPVKIVANIFISFIGGKKGLEDYALCRVRNRVKKE